MVEPTPAPPSSPIRASNADIAAAADAPASPAAATNPVRLSFGGHDDNKRLPSPNRGTKSPKKKVHRVSSSPYRRAVATREPTVEVSSVANGAFVNALFDTPRLSPTVLTVDPERLVRLRTIINSIKTKPISAKRAILPIRTTKAKTAPSRKSSVSKRPPPKSKKPVKIKVKAMKLTSNLFTDAVTRPHIFGDEEKNTKYSPEDMKGYLANYSKQLNFRFDEKRKRGKQSNGRVSTRSMADFDLDNDDDVFCGNTTNFKEMNRYVLEDILATDEKTPLLLCIATSMDDEYMNKLTEGAEQQKLAGVAGDICKISGVQYFCLRVDILEAPDHLQLSSGTIGESEFYKKYKRGDGFVVKLNDTDDGRGSPIKLTFKWKDLVQKPKEILFYGRRFETLRSFSQTFRRKSDKHYLFHVFKNLSMEYWGDATASAQLYAAYLTRRCEIAEEEVKTARLHGVATVMKSLNGMNKTQKVFVGMLDGLFKNCFTSCITTWNDYGTPICIDEDIERYMWAAENVAFPTQWKMLAGMRGVNENHAREKHRIDWKKL